MTTNSGVKEAKAHLVASLEELAEREIEDNSSLLSKERRIAAALIEGAAERSDIYKVVESDVNGFVSELINGAEATLRDIRCKTVGKEQAQKEAEKGHKTDADYASEAYERRQARQLAREEEVRLRLKREAKEREQRAEEARRKKEESEIREQERLERDALKRAEREKLYNLEREKERERKRKHEEEREQEREERRERRYREEEMARKDRRTHSSYNDEELQTRDNASSQREEKDLDEVALELLLRESQELAAKSKIRSETERPEPSESLSRRHLENGPKRTNNNDLYDEKLSRNSVEDDKSHNPYRASLARKISAHVSHADMEVRLAGSNTHESQFRTQGSSVEREPFKKVQDPNVHHSHPMSGRSIRSEAYPTTGEASRRSSNLNKGHSPDLLRKSLTPKKLSFPERSSSPRKRQRTRSRSLEGVDRYLPGSVLNQSNDREYSDRNYAEQLHWVKREEDHKPAYTHRLSSDNKYHSKDSQQFHSRERKERGHGRSWDRERDHEEHEPRENEHRKVKDQERERRTSWERSRDRSVDRDKPRIRDYERDGLRDRDRHRGRADDKDRERRRHEDYGSVRHRSRERNQYRKWSR